MGIDFQILVVEWSELAEMARQILLSYLGSQSLEDPDYKLKHDAAYPRREANLTAPDRASDLRKTIIRLPVHVDKTSLSKLTESSNENLR